MSLLAVNEVIHGYGAVQVLRGASLTVNARERVGLVGRNGSGKSTLLRIILGKEKPERGSVVRLPGLRLGALEQDPTFAEDATVRDVVVDSFANIRELHARMRRLETALEAATDADEIERLMAEYGEAQHDFEAAGGYLLDAKLREILFGLGFSEEDLARPARTLSGGQQRRLALAGLLLQEPDLLLLDEPTNHLDIATTEWLEEFLLRWKGAMLVVAHDKAFLDALCTKTVIIDEGETQTYPGNYSNAMRLRNSERERQEAQWRRQQGEIERLEAYIERYRAGNRATMSKSRQKALARIERIERPRGEETGPNLKLAPVVTSGREVLHLDRLSKRFGEKVLFERLSLTVERGERIGLVGPNGAGKSTLLRILRGEETPSSGTATFGHNVQAANFSQDLSELDPEATVLEEVLGSSDLLLGEARNFLAQFLFTADDVYKRTADLSGGEKNRVVLARLMLAGGNLLLLDEPTNHLDIVARESLTEALERYPGTVILATHDRALLDRLTTQIIEIADGQARTFRGTWSEYRAKFPRAGVIQPARKPAAEKKAKAPSGPARTLAVIEAEITAVETRLAQLSDAMADPATYSVKEKAKEVQAEYESLEPRLSELYAEWETAAG